MSRSAPRVTLRGCALTPQRDGGQAVHLGKPGEKQRANEASGLAAAGGIDNLAEYRAMLQRDFAFNGVVEKYASEAARTGTKGAAPHSAALYKAAEAPFLRDVIAAVYPGKKLDDPLVQPAVEIARNIWSYATRGMDCSGRTDVQELQGLLYVFDKQIAGSSNTNTCSPT